MNEIREKIARRIIKRLDYDISDRCGLKWEWAKIDKEVMEDELKPEWEKIIIEELSLETKTHRLAVRPRGESPELTPDGQQTALKTARQNSGGKILGAAEIYDAIVQGQKKLSDEYYEKL